MRATIVRQMAEQNLVQPRRVEGEPARHGRDGSSGRPTGRGDRAGDAPGEQGGEVSRPRFAPEYRYQSPIGLFRIRVKGDRWELWMGDECYGFYANPIAAADDVFTQATGCYEWDTLATDAAPTDLGEWEPVWR